MTPPTQDGHDWPNGWQDERWTAAHNCAMKQANLGDRRCPKCGGMLELVWQGEDRWRVSCMRNDMGDEPPPCSMQDVYGRTSEEAIGNFDRQGGVAPTP